MEAKGYETVTVDNDPRFNATHTCSIEDFDYSHLYTNKNSFDIIWASPPCTQYSRAKTCGKRDMETADRLVQKCLEIIRYYEPRAWFLENPYTGYLKSRPFMQDLPYFKIDYCCYENRGRRKATAIWTNVMHFTPKTCAGKGKCPNMIGSRHFASGRMYWDTRWKSKKEKSIDLAQVPSNLIEELIAYD